jgi:hypothetical protein
LILQMTASGCVLIGIRNPACAWTAGRGQTGRALRLIKIGKCNLRPAALEDYVATAMSQDIDIVKDYYTGLLLGREGTLLQQAR